MAIVGDVVCPHCDEDRVSLIHEIKDTLGKRYYCCVCGHEFKESKRYTAVVTLSVQC